MQRAWRSLPAIAQGVRRLPRGGGGGQGGELSRGASSTKAHSGSVWCAGQRCMEKMQRASKRGHNPRLVLRFPQLIYEALRFHGEAPKRAR